MHCAAHGDDAANVSCALSVDEVRDRGSPSRESQHTSQGLLVTRREVQLTFPKYPDVIEPALRLCVVWGPMGTKMPYRQMTYENI